MTILVCAAALFTLAWEMFRAFDTGHRRRRVWRDVEAFRRARG